MMKVFKIYCEDFFYCYQAKTEDEATTEFENDLGYKIDKIEEVHESKWDEKIIEMREDNSEENNHSLID